MTVAELKAQNSGASVVSRHVVFRHILVATDVSEASRRALCGALTLATDSDTQVSVIHVMRPDWRYASLENPPEIDLQRIDTEERLKAFVSEAAPSTKITTAYVRQAPVAEAVAAVIKEEGIDLLVTRNARARRPKQTGTRFGGGGTPACRTVPRHDHWPWTEPGSDHARARISSNSIRDRLRERFGERPPARSGPVESASGQADSAAYDLAYACNNWKPFGLCSSGGCGGRVDGVGGCVAPAGAPAVARMPARESRSGARTRVCSGDRLCLRGDPDGGGQIQG
jgi:nucleotide-binding universal stress UspA family protein